MVWSVMLCRCETWTIKAIIEQKSKHLRFGYGEKRNISNDKITYKMKY